MAFPIRRQSLTAALLALGAAVLYLPQLRDAPVYLGRDEMFFGLTAHSLASTGRDTTGRFMPLYFQTQMRYGSEMWFQPILMYATALTVKVSGLTEGTIRLPMALAGVLDVVLVYFIGRLLCRRETPAIAAAVLLALTPAHFVHSRVAMDFQTPLPFVLGWLLCVLLYLRRGQVALLFASGLLLGIGLYTYIASYMLMPIYALLTSIVLYRRRETLNRYSVLAAGFFLPALCALPFVLQHPTIVHDVMWHYDREQPHSAGAADLVASFVNVNRFAKAADVYWQFWSPRFLFINGPNSLWVAGAFLLVMAGMLAIGVLYALRRPVADATVLLLGGLLTAPIPASLVGDVDAIHRAAAALPFGVLVAMFALNYLWTAEHTLAARIAFVTTWVVVIGVAAIYHDQLPRAQGLIRAATVPLAMAGLCVSLRDARLEHVRPARLARIAIVALMTIQVAFLAFGYAAVAWASLPLLGILVVLLLSRGTGAVEITQAVAVTALAAASSHFMYAYADYSYVHRVRFVPATAILLALRFTYAAGALAAMIGVALAARSAVDRWRPGRVALVTAITVVALQLAYFFIDYFVDYRVRFIQAIVILAAAVFGAALLAKSAAAARPMLAQLTVTAVLGLASVQFAYFYVDYFTRYRDRSGNFEPEGNARVAWETLIERTRHRSVPAIYLSNVGPYGFSDLYWTFYTIKHHREDLLARTTSDVAFEPDRVRRLPDASLVVTSPSPGTDDAIARMLSAGDLRDRTLVTAPDGATRFWILETAARRSVAAR